MKLIALLMTHLASLFLVANTFAQGTSWQPSSIPPLSFGGVAVAKIYPDRDGTTVLGLISFEQVEQSYTVLVPYTEEVEQSIVDPNTGEARTQTVAVTKTMKETRTRTVLTSRRSEVPADGARFWTIGGESLSSSEAINTLAAARRCFLLQDRRRPPRYKGEPFFSEMFQDDVLVIWYEKDKAKKITTDKK